MQPPLSGCQERATVVPIAAHVWADQRACQPVQYTPEVVVLDRPQRRRPLPDQGRTKPARPSAIVAGASTGTCEQCATQYQSIASASVRAWRWPRRSGPTAARPTAAREGRDAARRSTCMVPSMTSRTRPAVAARDPGSVRRSSYGAPLKRTRRMRPLRSVANRRPAPSSPKPLMLRPVWMVWSG